MTNNEIKNFVRTLAFYANHVNYCFQHHLDITVPESQVDAIQFLLSTDCKGVTVEKIRSKPATPSLYSGFIVSRSGVRFCISCLSYGSFELDAQLRRECQEYVEYMGLENVEYL